MRNILVIFFILLFTGCYKNIPDVNERKATAFSLIKDKNIKEKIYYQDRFNTLSFQTKLEECKNINVYIEGDGLAWVSRNRVSLNPTPINPIALKLMLIDNSKCKIYLARPCQYTDSNACAKKYWTSHRFSEEIIDSYQILLDKIKDINNNQTFNIFGFSGGGAISTILAAKRDDVNFLVTIAGNLDIKKWVEIHNISKLNGSLNPIDFTEKLKDTKQYHLIGKNDKIIPKEVFLSYKSKFSDTKNINYKEFDTTHNKNWENVYPIFLNNELGSLRE